MPDQESLWHVVLIFPNAAEAEQACDLLRREGFWARVRPLTAPAEEMFEVVALESEYLEAREFLIEKGF